MKKLLILIIVLVVHSQPGRAQGMPVYDNTNFISLTKSLIESAKQTSQLLKTVQFLNEQKQRLEQVNEVIKQVRAVREIVENNQKLIGIVQGDLQEILASPYIRAEEIDRITISFNSILDMAMQDMNFMQQLLTSNLLNMTDADRLLLLEEQKERSREMIGEIKLRTKRYRAIISFREMQDRINHRDLNF